nr:hypothetical protein CFP56_01129 [Quercus suber]
MISYLDTVDRFRERWLYSNWAWALADEVITTLSGETWGAFLKSQMFDRLGMKRSTTNHDTSLDNVAEAYIALLSGRPHHLPRPFPGDGKVMQGAVAVQSCVSDLAKLYKAFMEAKSHQDSTGFTSTPGNPLAQIATITQGHIRLDPGDTKQERSYAIGWVRAELPTTLGAIGLNPTYMREMPIVGKGLPKSELCLYHQGSNNTFLNSVHLLPDSHSAVVVLTNSMANNDAADWLGEMLLEAVLDNADKNDYVRLAEISAAESKDRWKRMREELESKRTAGTTCRPLHAYCGSYYNRVGTYRIEVYQAGDQLKMCFQGDREFSYDLEHYHFDTFSWLLTRDEDAHYGRFPVTRASFYLFDFNMPRVGSEAESVTWIDDTAVPQGEMFRRRKMEIGVVHGESVVDGPG